MGDGRGRGWEEEEGGGGKGVCGCLASQHHAKLVSGTDLISQLCMLPH